MSSLERTPSVGADDPLGWLRERLPTLAFSMFFSAAEVRPGGVVALPNRFLRDLAAQKYREELRRYAASVGCGGVELVVDSGLAPRPEAEGEAPSLPVVPVQVERELPPGLTTRFFAERGFWLLSPLAPGRTLEVADLRGRLRVEAGAQGSCGMYEAMVLSGLLAIWGDGPRAEPGVECGLRRLSTVLGLAWGGRTAAQLRVSIERLKTTSFRTIVSDEDGGAERLFSLLDEIETTWTGPATTPHRHVRAVFSRTAWEVITTPRILRPVELAVLRRLGARRELARRLFYLLEAQPGHELRPGTEILERLVDDRLVASLGTTRAAWKVAQELRVAGVAICDASRRYQRVELVPRRRRSIAPGEPRWLLRVVRTRENKKERNPRR